MGRYRLIGICACLAPVGIPVGVQAAPEYSEQRQAYDLTRSGTIMSLRDIENRVVPRMSGAEYLGPELHDDYYRLKFIRNRAVIWVDVDCRTGAILRMTGN
jgi:uncharacterized membrane protein YkoI